MIQVKHAGDAVESEPVDFVLVEPIPAVGKQIMDHFGLAIVETA